MATGVVVEAAEGFLEREDGPRLFHRWRGAVEPRCVAVVVHGFGEHGGRYVELLEFLAARGCSALAIDRRGFGRSEGRRAFVKTFDDYLDDTSRAITEARRRGPGLPLVLIGHSVGGLVAGCFAVSRPGEIDGLVLSGPALRFGVRIPLWKRVIAPVMNRVWPTWSSPAGVDSGATTHDRAAREDFENDPLRVRAATVRWYVESRAAQQRLLAAADAVRVPLLVLLGSEDRIIDVECAKAFFARCAAPDKQLRVYDGMLHEVFEEVGREVVFDDLTRFLGRFGPTVS